MDAETIGLIIGGMLAALGAGAGAQRYLFNRRTQSGIWDTVETTNPSIVNTGQVKALDFVTESECRETRKDLTDSLLKSAEKTECALIRLTKTLNTLTNTVTKLEAKLDTLPTEIENARLKAMQNHESKFHGRPSTGHYGRPRNK